MKKSEKPGITKEQIKRNLDIFLDLLNTGHKNSLDEMIGDNLEQLKIISKEDYDKYTSRFEKEQPNVYSSIKNYLSEKEKLN